MHDMNKLSVLFQRMSVVTMAVYLLSMQVGVSAQSIPRINDGVIHFDEGEVRSVAVSHGQHPYILAALSFNGVVSLSAEGELLHSYDPDDPFSEFIGVAVSDMYRHGSRELLLVAMVDLPRFRIVLRGLDPDTGNFLSEDLLGDAGNLPVLPRTTHVCFSRDRYDNSLYLFAGGDHGLLYQFRITSGSSGNINVRELQQIVIGGPTSDCNSDDREGVLFVTEPAMGIWQVITDAEEVPLREPVALVEPYGRLGEPISLAGIFQGQERLILLADTGEESFMQLSGDGTIVSHQDFAVAFADHPLQGSVANIATGRLPVQDRIQDVIAVAVTGDAGDGEIHLIPINPPARARLDQIHPESTDAVVRSLALSDPVSGGMDAADDPAIWVNPDNPGESLVLGADKGAGLGVYDLNGRLLQFLPGARINNVDLRPGFEKHPTLSHLAIGSDRTNIALAIYAIDETTRRVLRVDARTIPAEFHDVYGLCMYRSHRTGDLYVNATSGDGLLHQWRLFPVGGNKVDAELVRRIDIGTVAEGCVADDENGFLYVAEERVGVWRYGAEPGDGDSRSAVAMIEAGGKLTADLEGLAIYKTSDTDGYLVVTSQGSDNYSVYNRGPPHSYRGTFRIRANTESGIDGTSQTDGIDVTNAVLPGYPQGLLVAQDGRYDESQNFKYVSWAEISEQLDLDE
jgi:3-phytase